MAEFYAASSVGEYIIFYRNILEFFGLKVVGNLYLDSAAARGILRREGVGKIKHLEIRALWVQQAVKKGLFTVKAVAGVDNPADLGTKIHPKDRLVKLLEKV